jgi:hypothetical protein
MPSTELGSLATEFETKGHTSLQNVTLDKLWDHWRDSHLDVPFLPEGVRMDWHVCPCTAKRTGKIPSLCTFEMPNPIGKVNMFYFLGAYQFTSMLSELVML